MSPARERLQASQAELGRAKAQKDDDWRHPANGHKHLRSTCFDWARAQEAAVERARAELDAARTVSPMHAPRLDLPRPVVDPCRFTDVELHAPLPDAFLANALTTAGGASLTRYAPKTLVADRPQRRWQWIRR